MARNNAQSTIEGFIAEYEGDSGKALDEFVEEKVFEELDSDNVQEYFDLCVTNKYLYDKSLSALVKFFEKEGNSIENMLDKPDPSEQVKSLCYNNLTQMVDISVNLGAA